MFLFFVLDNQQNYNDYQRNF